MDLQSLYRTMVRRKVVVIPMILLVVAGLYYVYSAAPPVYKATGSIALANPEGSATTTNDDSEPADAPKGSDNPFLRYNDLTVVEDMVVRLVSSPTIDAKMRQNGVVGTYVIGSADIMYRGPIIDVTAEADSAEAAKTSATLVMKEIGSQLAVIQTARGTAKPYQIYTLPVVKPESATAVFSGTLRRLMMGGVLGAIAVVASGLIADRLADRRNRRRQARVGADADADEATTPDAGPLVAATATPSDAGDDSWPVGSTAAGDASATDPRYHRQREARRGNLARPQRRSRSARS